MSTGELNKEILDKFAGKVDFAQRIFCVWKFTYNRAQELRRNSVEAMKEGENAYLSKLWPENFWNPILFSLQRIFVLEIAKLLDGAYFDKSKEEMPNLSINYILESSNDSPLKEAYGKKLNEQQEFFRSIKIFRKKYLAHNDLNMSLKNEEVKIKAGIEIFFEVARDLIEDIKKKGIIYENSRRCDFMKAEQESEMAVNLVFDMLNLSSIENPEDLFKEKNEILNGMKYVKQKLNR